MPASAPSTPSPVSPSSIIGKTAWSTIASVSVAAASAVSTIVVSRLLGAAGAGRFAYGVWVASTVAQVALFALPQVALRFLASPADKAGLPRWLVRRVAILTAPAALVAGALAHFSSEAPSLVAATSVLAGFTLAGSMGQAMLLGNQEYRRLTVVSLVASALQVGGTAVGCIVWGPVGGILASALGQAPLIAGMRATSPDPRRPDPAVIRRITSFALHSWVASTVSLVAWSRLEFAFLRGFGAGVIGQYAVALAVAQLGLQPATLVGNALLPHFGELVGGSHTDASRETYAAVTRVSALLSLPLCLGLAGVAPALVPALFGEPFAAAVLPAEVMVAAGAFVALAPAANAMTYAYERTRYISTATVTSSAMAALAFWFVIPRFGAVGAAAVRSFIQASGVAVGFLYVHHALSAPFPLGRTLRAATAAVLSAIAGRLVVKQFEHPWPALLAGVATVAAVYALIVPHMGAIERSDVAHLDRFAARLPWAFGRWARRYLASLAR